MIKSEKFDKVFIRSQFDLRDRLTHNFDQEKSVRLVTYKKIIPEYYVSKYEVIDELLCFGRIDGIMRKIDQYTVMQLISSRKTQHRSQTYKNRFEILSQLWKIHKSWYDSVKLSHELWLRDYMHDVDNCIIPQDMIEVSLLYPNSIENFKKYWKSIQRFTLRWIKLAKTQITRNKRIHKSLLLASLELKIPWL